MRTSGRRIEKELNRRIARASDAGTAYAYQWEGDRLIAEAPMTADGAVAWDQARHWVYEPGSFRPLAQAAGEDLHYIVTDHIGTPRELFSEDGARVDWRAEWSLWGDLAELKRKAANDDAAPVDCPIRFQGQWYDAESGLHYNRFRYYDADAMQYLSPDPIGLAGGVRPQGYVGNPNGWVDPLGLKVDPPVIVDGRAEGTHQQLVSHGHKDSHHIIQDAAVRDLPGYDRNQAPTIQLEGPANRVGTEHNAAKLIQRQAGGGTY